LDGDGSIKADGNIRFATVSERVALGVRELVWSLGGRAKIVKEENRTYKYKGESRRAKDAYWINGICGLTVNPFSLDRKAERFAYSGKSASYARKVVSVVQAGRVHVQCLAVSADSGLYIAYDNIISRGIS
jgi:replicative DNA helicase